MMKKFAYNLNELLKAQSATNWEDLNPRYDSRKSFYGKAKVKSLVNGVKLLLSYNAVVACILPDGKFLSNGIYSATTSRHEKEFAKQFSADYQGDKLENYVTGKDFPAIV